MFLLAKYGVETAFTFPMVKRAVVDFAVAADWTPAAADCKISKDGGNFAQATNTIAAVGGTGSAGWTLTLTATELTAGVIDVQIVDAATKAVEDQFIKIYTFGNASAKIILDLSTNQRDLINAPNATALNAAADALLNRDMATGTDSNLRSVRNALRRLRNKCAVVTGAMTVYKENDSTEAWSATTTSDASANPITAITPDE